MPHGIGFLYAGEATAKTYKDFGGFSRHVRIKERACDTYVTHEMG